jgi:hypothetical protein
MKGGGGGAIIGYSLGGGVIIPCFLYLISIIFFNPNKVTETVINQYIGNSIEIQADSAGNVSYWDRENSNGKLGLQSIRIRYFLAKGGEGAQYYHCFIFNSNKYHKYFKLIALSGVGAFIRPSYYVSIIITVNKDDFNNPAYGTIDNPIPVLKFIGKDQSLRPDNKDYDKTLMTIKHRKNVEIYLKYVMPKKEFKERFGK